MALPVYCYLAHYFSTWEEALNYASVLGYNYRSSEWYEASYKVLNKNYSRIKKNKNDKRETILKKFKKIFQ